MATRRVRVIENDEDIQVLKLGAPNPFVMSTDDDDQQILMSPARKAPDYEAVFGAQHDIDNDKLNLIAYVEKNKKDIIHAADCVFKVYLVNELTWAETLEVTVSGAQQSNGMFTASIPYTSFSVGLDGREVFAVEVTLKRFKKTYRLKRYVNDIGIFDTYLRLRRKINILEATDVVDESVFGRY